MCKHMPHVHTYARIAGVCMHVPWGTPGVVPVLEGGPPAPVILGGMEGKAGMEGEMATWQAPVGQGG